MAILVNKINLTLLASNYISTIRINKKAWLLFHENLKSFTENASHEIQTPIAVIKSNIEFLFSTESLSKKQLKYITAIGEYTTKLEKLTQSKFSISNTGIPLTIKPNQLFERFRKDNQSSQSLGLGLAIVKKICELNQLQIQYQYKKQNHIFKIIWRIYDVCI